MKPDPTFAACIAIATALAPALAIGAGALDAAAPAPLLDYRSAFDGYRPFADVEPKSWRALNDTVRQVGGHAGAVKASGDAADKAAASPAKGASGAVSRPPPAEAKQ